MIIEEGKYLMHYGILRKSGRYPWGSGGNSAQRSKTFLDMVSDLRSQGMNEKEIAAGFGMTTTQLREANTLAKTEKKQADIAYATRLKEKQYSNVAIGKKMGINESSVRSLLAPGQKEKLDILQTTANMLRDQVAEKKYLDIGSGNENYLGISKEKLKTAVSILKDEGYQVHNILEDQLGTRAGNKTKIKVLAPPGTTYKEVVQNRAEIKMINQMSEDGGRTFFGLLPPLMVRSKRIDIKYAEDGGSEADGVIYIRPGVKDLSMGDSKYAQVRINVDGTHYLKGMAIYKDDLPEGIDIQFNTNKTKAELGPNKLAAMKEQKQDKDNPFGSMVRQITEKDESGKPIKVTSALNIVNEEGDWSKWKKTISSQVLSKQSPKLAKTQLDMAFEKRKNEFDTIMNLTNPVVRKKLLNAFADEADSAAVHLKAAALPRTQSHVIIPVNTMKETEIYAPRYNNGERVALIRYPHGGTFEIPELIVNNKHPEAVKTLGDAQDAVGINHEVAKRLSGADFDGDTVLVIPNPINNANLKTQPALEGLKNFDPQHAYPAVPGTTFKGNKQKLMGDISNLITDMTIKGANPTELAAAVRHSMVVIDAEKHNLNYKQSAIDNGILALKTKYQGDSKAGASTLISRATSRQDVPARKPRPASLGGPIDKATGRKEYVNIGTPYERTKVNKRTGEVTVEVKQPMHRSTKLAETDDAFTLSSGTLMEKVYAEYSNKVKALANTARRELVATPPLKYSPSARKAYDKEVKSLNAKLNVALMNSPRERQAQLFANKTVAMKKLENPDMDRAELKKIEAQALNEARLRVGAKKASIEPTQEEWNAIQAGAISDSKLEQILNNANLDVVKTLATPKTPILMTSTKTQRAKAMAASGYTQAEIASALGVSVTTLQRSISS